MGVLREDLNLRLAVELSWCWEPWVIRLSDVLSSKEPIILVNWGFWGKWVSFGARGGGGWRGQGWRKKSMGQIMKDLISPLKFLQLYRCLRKVLRASLNSEHIFWRHFSSLVLLSEPSVCLLKCLSSTLKFLIRSHISYWNNDAEYSKGMEP